MKTKKFLVTVASVMCAAAVMNPCMAQKGQTPLSSLQQMHKGHDCSAYLFDGEKGVKVGRASEERNFKNYRLDYIVFCSTCCDVQIKYIGIPVLHRIPVAFDKYNGVSIYTVEDTNGKEEALFSQNMIFTHEGMAFTIDWERTIAFNALMKKDK